MVEFDKTLHENAVTSAVGAEFATDDLACVGVSVEGVSGDTITFQGSINGTDWYSLLAIKPADGVRATTAAADGLFIVPIAGIRRFRANLSRVSGTVTVIARGSYAPYTPMVTTALS